MEEYNQSLKRIEISKKNRALKPSHEQLLKQRRDLEIELEACERRTYERGYKLEGGKMVPGFDVSQLIDDKMVKKCDQTLASLKSELAESDYHFQGRLKNFVKCWSYTGTAGPPHPLYYDMLASIREKLSKKLDALPVHEELKSDKKHKET
jgi:hypothetical protein